MKKLIEQASENDNISTIFVTKENIKHRTAKMVVVVNVTENVAKI